MTQAEAFEILKTGAPVFLTGNAGSGKTYLLNRYIAWLKHMKVGFAVTASTGIAATHISGMTIHSFSGIGIRKFLSEQDLDELTHRKYLWDRFSKTKVLIIDEISMLHAGMLDMVEKVCRTFMQNDLPFGGLQIVLCGDFFQLPPVDKQNDDVNAKEFAYNSFAWKSLDPVICYLSEQHRQNDPEFTEILNAIRGSNVTKEITNRLKSRIGIKNENDKVARLFAHNEDVDKLNHIELEKLSGKEIIYAMETHGRGAMIEGLKKSVLAPEALKLKEGALVMCVKNNYEKGYVNGTLGTVVSCNPTAPTIRTHHGKVITVMPESWSVEEGGKIKAQVTQVPLRLAWAITIHKSQGMSLDAAEVDLSRSFAHGMGYVALSRVRSLSGLTIVGINEMALSVHPDVREKDEEFLIKSDLAGIAFKRFGASELLGKQKLFVDRAKGQWSDKEVPAQSTKVFFKKDKKVPTESVTLRLIEEGKSIHEAAKERGLTFGTILSHLEDISKKNVKINIDHLMPSEDAIEEIRNAFQESKDTKLTPVKKILEKKGLPYSFDEIRIARLFLDIG